MGEQADQLLPQDTKWELLYEGQLFLSPILSAVQSISMGQYMASSGQPSEWIGKGGAGGEMN